MPQTFMNFKKINKILLILLLLILMIIISFIIPKYLKSSTSVEIVNSEIKYVNEKPISGLAKQVSNKEYIRASIDGLLYTQANNQKLIEILDNYDYSDSTLRQEELANLISIHQKTFLNRYLKIYILQPQNDLNEIDQIVKRKLYDIKKAYEKLSHYGNKNYKTIKNSDGEEIKSNKLKTMYKETDLIEGCEELKNVTFNMESIIKDLSLKDALIEQEWLNTELTEKELIDVLDKTNVDIIGN